MITRNDFRQNRLIERIDEILHPKVRARLDADWAGVFRTVFLQMMPVDDIGQGFSRDFGRPTREHYSICGLLLLKDYFGWTVEETVKQYLYDLEIHYALRIEPDCLELSTRTLERYLKIFRKNELAQKLMDTVTRKIINDLNIKVDKQRLDSTHIFSNMADLTRSMLMFRTVKRFLIQVKRHESKLYKLSKINTFKDLARVFNEQCELVDGNLQRRKHPGGGALVNTSDPDAGVDNKGVGYQAQVSQTHNPENPVQIITAVIPQSASEADQNAVEPMLEKMKRNNAVPEECSADTAYGSDKNVLKAAEQGVELLAPASGKEKGSLWLEECEFDENNRLLKCPLGKKPLKSTFKDGKGRAVFACNICGKCPEYKRCCTSKSGNNYVITYDDRGLRLRERRLYEQSEEFYERHKFRGGIEALFGNLKQNTPLRRLAVRGKEAVFSAIYSIMAVHNIMQAAKVYANQGKTIPKKMGQAAKSFVPAIRTGITGVRLAFLAPMAA